MLFNNFYKAIKKEGDVKLYLPKAEENNPFDAHELCQGLVWFQLLCKHMIKQDKGIKSQWNWKVKNDGECPAQPIGIHPKNL